jgi:hypothetical protein
MGKIDELKKSLEELKGLKPATVNGQVIQFMEDRRKKLIRDIEKDINDIETRIKDEVKVFELINPIIFNKDFDFSDQALIDNWQPYQLHDWPWKIDRGQIKDKHGNVIGNYAFTLGDETDHSCGRLMAKSPELLALLDLTLRTIGDVIRSEPDMRESNREVLDEISDMIREAIQDKAGAHG